MGLIFYQEEEPFKITPWIIILIILIMITATGVFVYKKLYPQTKVELMIDEINETPTTLGQPTTTSPATTTSPSTTTDIEMVGSNTSDWGFKVNLPQTWQINPSSGVIILKSDECASSGAVLYPVKPLIGSLTAQIIAQKFVNSFNATGSDNKLILGDVLNQPSNQINTLISGRICGNEIAGNAQIQIAGDKAIFKMTWMPQKQYETNQVLLKDITDSFELLPLKQELILRGNQLQLAVPKDWSVVEQEQSIAVEKDQTKLIVSTMPTLTISDPEELIEFFIQLQRDNGTELESITSDKQHQGKIELANENWQIGMSDLTFRRSGQKWQAQAIAGINQAYSDQALLLWREGPVADWQSVQPILSMIEQTVSWLPVENQDKRIKLPMKLWQMGSSIFEQFDFNLFLKQTQYQQWQNLILGLKEIKKDSQIIFIPSQ